MKNFNIFRIISTTVLAGLLLLLSVTGCEDALLDQKPRGELTLASFFETEEQAIEATNATYNRLRTWNFANFMWLGLTDIASDDANKGSTPGDAAATHGLLDSWTFDPSTPNFRNTYIPYYVGIFRANTAITNIPDVTDMDETLKARLIGENKFLRAHFYFFLVRAFGGVPLIAEPQDPAEAQIPRASAEEVFAFIEQDLRDAIDVLPLKSEYPSSELGRATKGAARGILAKVLLFQEKYGEAEQFARDVINSGEYDLFPDYKKIFWPEGENSSESLFEIQAIALEPNQGGTQYSVHQGVRGQPNMGWGFNNPSDDLLSSYEPGDPRLGSTVLFIHETLPFGPVDVPRHNPQMLDNQRYNQKPFRPLDAAGGNANSGTNHRILRYSDVLLTAAESAFRNGNTGDAQNYVNMVRERARNGQTATLGLEPEGVSFLVADTLGMPEMEGSPFVRFASEGGPAANAGLRTMDWQLVDGNSVLVFDAVDIILTIDGVEVSSVEDYRNEMRSKNPNQTVNVEVMSITESFDGGTKVRDIETQVLTITTAELLPDVNSSGQQLLEDIWHERRVELAMEQHRMWDLRRTGRAGEVLRALGKNFEDNKHELYPIPRDEIDLNPELTQNPGY
jgi:hypothetical protein